MGNRSPRQGRGPLTIRKRTEPAYGYYAVATASQCLRRYRASIKDAGVPDAVVMALVGHESSAMSHRYTHVGKGALSRWRHASRNLNHLLPDLHAPPRGPAMRGSTSYTTPRVGATGRLRDSFWKNWFGAMWARTHTIVAQRARVPSFRLGPRSGYQHALVLPGTDHALPHTGRFSISSNSPPP